MLKNTIRKTRKPIINFGVRFTIIVGFLFMLINHCFAKDIWEEEKNISFRANIVFSKPLTGVYNHGTYNYDEGQDDVKIFATGNIIESNGKILQNFKDLLGILVHGEAYDYFQFDIDQFRLQIWEQNSEVLKKVLMKSTVVSQSKRQQENTEGLILPPFELLLKGSNEVRIKNPNDFDVNVGLRSKNNGKNFEVVANGLASVFVPDGAYEIYFVYSDKPDALFQGDGFILNNNGIEIQIVKVVSGNYGIRQIK